MSATISTNEIYVGESTSVVLTDYLDGLETNIGGKAASNHSHSDLESAIDALDSGKAASSHTHAMSDVTGLNDKLDEIDDAITALQNSGSGVTPMLIASMHLGKLDNNSGSETASSTRICSDPFAIEPNKSYWQVNDKAVNMYVLLYDAEEVFLEYMGSFASGAEIAVTNANAAYMRLGSLIGEYDLTNEFRIYNVDPESGGSSTGDVYTKEEADERFATISHTHSGYAAADHTHDGYAASSHTHTAADITGLPSSVDAYSKTESDAKYAASNHTHSDYMTEDDAVDSFAGINHTHSGYASSNHTHNYLPLSGGTVTGETNFSGGLIRVGGQQSIYDSGTMVTLSTNNRQTMIAGSAIYSKQTIQVSSDERLKENIKPVDPDKCVDFINGIDVKTFNYIGNDVPCMGVIAQDIQETELAKYFVSVMDCPEKYLSVKASDMVFPLIVAVQKLSERVKELENRK